MKVKGAVQSISLELDKKIMDANYFGPITLTKGILFFLPFSCYYLKLEIQVTGFAIIQNKSVKISGLKVD